jgi:mono/diheme cytochrome c family protein
VVVVVLVLALVIAAFGGSSSGPQKTVGTFNPQLQFEVRCFTCHRVGPGPRLSGPTLVKTFPTVEDQITFVANGKDGMPAFKDRLTHDELRQIVEYTRTLP